MSSRNKLANRKNLLQLEADYELKIATKATVTLQFPFMDHLYDGPFAVLSCIYSKTKEACKWGDMYARETTLDKGTYTVKLGKIMRSASNQELKPSAQRSFTRIR